MNNPKTFLYCDGAHIQGSLQSGYGLIAKQEANVIHTEYGKLLTDNSMESELIAVLHAIEYIHANPGKDYVIVSDCKEVVECMVGNSMRKKCLELWQRIEKLSEDVDYHIAHINKKALDLNSDHVRMNKRVDALAYKGATQIAKEYFIS